MHITTVYPSKNHVYTTKTTDKDPTEYYQQVKNELTK